MSTSVQLEPGNAAHVDELVAVMDESFDPEFGEAWTAAQCAGLLPMRGVWLTLARREGRTLGFTLGRIIIDEAELLLLAVRRSAQRQGIGATLLQSFERTAAVRGASKVHLEVREGNPAASLYAAADFHEVGRRRDYYSGKQGHMYNAITLAKKVKL